MEITPKEIKLKKEIARYAADLREFVTDLEAILATDGIRDDQITFLMERILWRGLFPCVTAPDSRRELAELVRDVEEQRIETMTSDTTSGL